MSLCIEILSEEYGHLFFFNLSVFEPGEDGCVIKSGDNEVQFDYNEIGEIKIYTSRDESMQMVNAILQSLPKEVNAHHYSTP